MEIATIHRHRIKSSSGSRIVEIATIHRHRAMRSIRLFVLEVAGIYDNIDLTGPTGIVNHLETTCIYLNSAVATFEGYSVVYNEIAAARFSQLMTIQRQLAISSPLISTPLLHDHISGRHDRRITPNIQIRDGSFGSINTPPRILKRSALLKNDMIIGRCAFHIKHGIILHSDSAVAIAYVVSTKYRIIHIATRLQRSTAQHGNITRKAILGTTRRNGSAVCREAQPGTAHIAGELQQIVAVSVLIIQLTVCTLQPNLGQDGGVVDIQSTGLGNVIPPGCLLGNVFGVTAD